MSSTAETTEEPVALRVPKRGTRPLLICLFVATTLVGATLLFAVEPMVAKMLLPPYGGSPMVWNTAVLFFQAALLAGYAYAHWSARRLGARWQPLVQLVLVLLPLLVLPVALPAWAAAPESSSTALWLLVVLAVMVGAPFTVLATTGPMVQRWYSWTGLPRASDPYFLYAAGNVGSLLALLAYPFLIEPLASLPEQARWWGLGYGAFAVLMVACALSVRLGRRGDPSPPSSEDASSLDDASPSEEASPSEAPPPEASPSPAKVGTWRRRARWVVLAFIPSSLMLGVTTHITTDISPVPLIWIVPLALYLLTFIVAFGARSQWWLTPAVFVSALLALVLPWFFVWVGHVSVALMVPVDCALVVVAGLACHGLLAADRPPVRRLTEFYLLVSIGGALGGVFNGLLAPLLFNWVMELPLVVAMLGLAPVIWLKVMRKEATPDRKGFPLGFVLLSIVLGGSLLWLVEEWWVLAVGAAPLVAWLLGPVKEKRLAIMAGLFLIPLLLTTTTDAQVRERTFFGTYKISERDGSRFLAHGTTEHGYQRLNAAERRMPVSYYSKTGPLGDVFGAYDRSLTDAKIGIVGLGTGVIAAYGEAGQKLDFYEIDPAVVTLARGHFTYLADCACDIRTVIGDGRLQLERASDRSYGLLVLDAFTSDAVPVHLLTREALELYERKLRPGGVLVLHISNRHLDLGPMLAATARAAGLSALEANDGSAVSKTSSPSRWVAIGRSDDDLAPLKNENSRWRRPEEGGPVWTDTYSSLAGVLEIVK